MQRIKWCVIGAGGIADRRTIPAILSDPNSKIVAIMDTNEELVGKLALKYGVKCYTDAEKMLENEDCDCVWDARFLPLSASYACVKVR